MPSLSLGAGIAQGASAFVNSFLQAKQLKNQEKMQKNAFLVSVLTKQLEDDNVSYFQRAKILDAIPNLIGAKPERPLSEILGLHELEEPVEQARPSKQGTSDKQISGSGQVQDVGGNGGGQVSTTGLDLGQTSATLRGTEATSAIPASLERKGDLTPALIKKRLLIETQKAVDEQDIEKQTKLARINNEIQMESLKALGFTKEVSRGFDSDNNYVVTMANAAGQTKKINLGNMTPEAIMKANISSNRPSKSMQALEDYYLTQTNPETGKAFTQEEAYAKALEDTHNSFQLQQRSRQAYVKSIEQNISGNKPLTPAQVADDTRANSQLKLQIMRDVDESKAKVDSTLAERERLAELKNQAATESSKAADEFAAIRAEDDDPDSTAYKNAAKKAQDKLDEYNKLEMQYNQAHSAYILANSLYSSATERAKQFQTTNKYTPEIQGAINVVRKNNPQQTASMTDEEIYNYLVSKGKIK